MQFLEVLDSGKESAKNCRKSATSTNVKVSDGSCCPALDAGKEEAVVGCVDMPTVTGVNREDVLQVLFYCRYYA